MPVFSRRRLQIMLHDLASVLTAEKANDLLHRLEHKNTQAALAAEAELSLLWATSIAAHLSIEPELSDGRRPDAASNDLFASGPSIIEITALSDDTFSGKQAMERTANKLIAFAHRVRRGAGHKLRFEFLEESFWRDGRYHRVRCVASDFAVTPYFDAALREWLPGPLDPQSKIRLSEGDTDVIITWYPGRVHPQARTFCRMPPVAYDVEDNPVYKALQKKAERLKRVPATYLRCVFLFDVGCDLLRRLKPMGRVFEVSGHQILQHALSKLKLDVICVFSVERELPRILETQRDRIYWQVTYFDRRKGLPPSEYAGLRRLTETLPPPRYEGYQVRSCHEQGDFDMTKPTQHLNTFMSTTAAKATIKVSARLVQELLAGRISAEEFQKRTFQRDSNQFDRQLNLGPTVARVGFEPGGVDQDDDYIVFDFEPDFAVSPLRRGSCE